MRMFTYLPMTDSNPYYNEAFGSGRVAASIKAGRRAVAQHSRTEAAVRNQGAVEGIPGGWVGVRYIHYSLHLYTLQYICACAAVGRRGREAGAATGYPIGKVTCISMHVKLGRPHGRNVCLHL